MNLTYIEHQAISCSNYENPNNYFSDTQIKALSCFDNMNFTLGGTWDEDYSRFLSIRIKYCRNNTYDDYSGKIRTDCLSIDEQIKKVKGLSIVFFYANKRVDPTNPDNPTIQFIQKFLLFNRSL